MINYFDIGLHNGEEIQMFIDAAGNLPYTIYGFEPHPELYAGVTHKYNDNPKVKIYPYAIGKETRTTPLYLSKNSEGHSIFPDKNNVTRLSIPVKCINFAEFFLSRDIPPEDINILRFNIEGAELDLIESLMENSIIGAFDLYLGAKPGVDLLKVASLAPKYSYYIDILKKYGITIHPFCYSLNDNFNLKNWLNLNCCA